MTSQIPLPPSPELPHSLLLLNIGCGSEELSNFLAEDSFSDEQQARQSSGKGEDDVVVVLAA